MYRRVFQNRKVALAFAGMTLFSAISMIGTKEEGGTLTRTVDLLEARRGNPASDGQPGAEAQRSGDARPVHPPVFGDYDPAEVDPPEMPSPARQDAQRVGTGASPE
jgi:hypothetical protein